MQRQVYRAAYRPPSYHKIARKFDGSEPPPNPKTKKVPETGVYLSKESIEQIVNRHRGAAPGGSTQPIKDPATVERFRMIRRLLQGCETIDEEIIEIAIYDLDQSEHAYFAGVYKASVVMLGAVLEGAMMGMLTRQDVIDEMRSAEGDKFKRIGTIGKGWNHRDFVNKVRERGTFDEYAFAVNQLIRGFESRGVKYLQGYRNAVHPYKVMTDPDLYKVYDEPIAQSHISSMVQAIKLIVKYTPENVPEEQEELT